jgi:hypothetical protein
MRLKVTFALGLGLGTALYQAIRYGVDNIDWPRVAFIFALGFVVALLLPRRFLERPERGM